MSKVTEELAPASLPKMIEEIGLGIAKANDALLKAGTDVVYTMPSAEIELSVAISTSEEKSTSVGGSVGISAVSVNASYASTYGFNESASSKIKVTLQAVPRAKETPTKKA